jgi:hypothetical protein
MQDRYIVQVGIVVKDLEKTIRNYYDVLKTGPWDIFEFGPPDMREGTYRGQPSDWSAVVGFCWIGDQQLEIIQPLKGPSIYHEHLQKKGEGLHHIKEKVDDCRKVIEEYRKKGIPVIQSGKYGDGEFYYLDTESYLGMIIEISKKDAGKDRVPSRRYPV